MVYNGILIETIGISVMVSIGLLLAGQTNNNKLFKKCGCEQRFKSRLLCLFCKGLVSY